MIKYKTVWIALNGATVSEDLTDRRSAFLFMKFLRSKGCAAWVENSEGSKVKEDE